MPRSIRHLCCFWMCQCLLAAAPVHAQPMAEEFELKAAFVYNFTLFTNWPKPGRDLRLCLRGEVLYAAQLKDLDGRSINGGAGGVLRVPSVDDERDCQVMVIGSGNQVAIANSLKRLAKTPVLLVTDAANPSAELAHIVLIKADDRLTFDVNQTEAVGTGLSFSFKLLKLARKVN